MRLIVLYNVHKINLLTFTLVSTTKDVIWVMFVMTHYYFRLPLHGNQMFGMPGIPNIFLMNLPASRLICHHPNMTITIYSTPSMKTIIMNFHTLNSFLSTGVVETYMAAILVLPILQCSIQTRLFNDLEEFLNNFYTIWYSLPVKGR